MSNLSNIMKNIMDLTDSLEIYQNIFEHNNVLFDATNKMIEEQRNEFLQVSRIISEKISALNHVNLSIQIPDIYFSLPIFDFSDLQSAINAAGIIHNKLEFDHFSSVITEMTSGVSFAMKRMIADLSAIKITTERLYPLGVFDELFQRIDFDSTLAETFKLAGWPLAPSLPREVRQRAIELYNEGKSKYIVNVIIGYYKRKKNKYLKMMVAAWENRPFFKERMHIFNACLDAHCEGK